MDIREYAKSAEKELIRCAMEKGGTYEEVYEEFKRLKSEEGKKLERMLEKISRLPNEIDNYKNCVKNGMERHDKLESFKSSEIGKMIADFCRENTEEKLVAIQEKSESDCGFEIKIRISYSYDEEGNEILTYDPHESRFVLKDPYHWYYFDDFNIDEDLRSINGHIKHNSDNLSKAKKELKDIKEEIGDDDYNWLLDNIETYFEYGRRRMKYD